MSNHWLLALFFALFLTSFSVLTESHAQVSIPDWVKNNAGFWASGQITDSEFIAGIEYMIKEGIIQAPQIEQQENVEPVIPKWIKNSAGWWANGIISNDEFSSSIEFLLKKNVIRLDSETQITQSQSQTVQTIPATSKTTLNFYVNDQDLNTSPNGIDEISTEGLIEVFVNDVLVNAPSVMVETAPNSGKFFLKISLPATIDGRPLQQDDIVLVKYLDQSNRAGEKQTIEQSVRLSSEFAKVETSGGGSRIGREFTLRLYEPDANTDSKDEDKIPLSALEFRAEGGIRTTLANPIFRANSAFLIETGPNSDVFEVKIEIPRTIDGETMHIGDWYEIRYFDRTNPSETTEKIILKGRIG
ncbi:MAG: hypothetical protein ACE5RT_05165 [Nitrosopumilaceae archaeon]